MKENLRCCITEMVPKRVDSVEKKARGTGVPVLADFYKVVENGVYRPLPSKKGNLED